MDVDAIQTPAQLRAALNELIAGRGLTYDAIQAATGISRGTLGDIRSGRTELPRWSTLEMILRNACGVTGAAVAAWERAHDRAEVPGIGVALTGDMDPFELGVHTVITVDDEPAATQALTVYVPRPHDVLLAEIVATAAAGVSAMVVLVADSSTGKTRALWEALKLLQEQGGWRLWHPRSPNRRAALRDGLNRVRPWTVVWLNESQEYLGGDTRPGDEDAAVALHKLLKDPERAPVLVVGTLWREYYTALRTPHASPVRELLAAATVLEVPASFTGADPVLLAAAAARDPRMRLALNQAEDDRLTQYLAGGPEQVHRYDFELSAAAKAIVEVAMDARRMGHDNEIPHAFLETGAYAYMSEADWQRATADSDWFERALAETARPCRGADGPLTRLQPPPIPSRINRSPAHRAARNAAASAVGPLYGLADYLDQHGRRTRAEQIPPIGFWEAAAHNLADHQNTFAEAARARGLYRDAAQLSKNAITRGHSAAAYGLVRTLHSLFPDDRRPATWAATNISLVDPSALAMLLYALRDAEAGEQVQALLARDPATHTSLDNPYQVAQLLHGLQAAGADEQVQVLLARDPATHTSLHDSYGLPTLMDALRWTGAHEQAQALAARAATHISLDNPNRVAELLHGLQAAGADEQVQVLLARDPATHISLDHTNWVRSLLKAMREAGAHEQMQALAARAATDLSLDDPGGVTELLITLQEAGLPEQMTALATRAATDLSLDSPYLVGTVLNTLRNAGLLEQMQALAARAATDVSLDYPKGVADLLGGLRKAGAHEQVQTLLARDPAGHAPLENPYAVFELLVGLQKAGDDEQVQALLARDPATHVSLQDPNGVILLLTELRKAGVDEQAQALLARDPATHASLENPGAVVWLLNALRWEGAHEQVQALATRAATHVHIVNSGTAIPDLLRALEGVGAHQQMEELSRRLPAAGMFQLFVGVSSCREQFRYGMEPDNSPAQPWTWDDLE